MKPTLYPDGFPSVYDELKTFYPVFYRDVFEMDAIWRVCGGGLDEVEDATDSVANNTFISLMDENAISLMETFLGITSTTKKDLETRRKLVASYFLGADHIGAPEIKEITSAFTSGECEVAFKDGTVYIHIKADINDTPATDDYYSILRKRIPAHLGVDTDVEVEFSHTVYFGSNAFQNDRYSVIPPAPIPQSGKGTLYLGGMVGQNDRVTVDLHRQPGLSFEAGFFVAQTGAESTSITVQPKAAEQLSTEVSLYMGAGLVESTHVSTDLALQYQRPTGETTVLSGGGLAESSHFTVDPTPVTRLEEDATVYSGGGIIENTHYTIQTQGGN